RRRHARGEGGALRVRGQEPEGLVLPGRRHACRARGARNRGCGIGGVMAARSKMKRTEYLTPEAQKALADRPARAEGRLRSVRQMVLDHRCADEILVQLGAVKAALNQTAAGLIEQELRTCATSCMKGDADERLARVTKALATVFKAS